jgi:putative solute:sodium symporter small subunit
LTPISFDENTRHTETADVTPVAQEWKEQTQMPTIFRIKPHPEHPEYLCSKTLFPVAFRTPLCYNPATFARRAMADPESSQKRRRDYWRENLRIMAWLLAVWFLVSYGCGIIFVDVLNKISLGGFQLGFWMAQQGSIYVFVVLIFVYVRLMNKLDKKYGFDKENESESDKKEDA